MGAPPLLLIAGPTAGGKSALALRLAAQTGGEIVNADSLQVYGDLAILTARPTPHELSMAPHHLYGVADAAEAWSAGRWLAAARKALAEIAGRGRRAIVVGGTGLYLRGLTVGLAEVPAIPSIMRQESQSLFNDLGETLFRRRLAVVDPEAEARIAPKDRQRLTRAHEVFAVSGVPLSVWQKTTTPALAPGAWRGVVVEPPRAGLYRRCDARLAVMIDAGALNEVAALVARGLDRRLPAMKAMGVAPLSDHLAGRLSAKEALAAAQGETRRYAKRQLTWFRNQTPDWPRIAALDGEGQWRQLIDLLSTKESRP